jgi:hypothetical protein
MMGTLSFLGMKRQERGVKHTHTSSAEVKEIVELYLYFHSRCSWPVTGRTLPLLTTHLNLFVPMVPALQISEWIYFVLCIVPMRATVPPHFNKGDSFGTRPKKMRISQTIH